MALYTNETAVNIRERMLARIESKYDKRIGSIIFNGLAPTAEELAIVYEALDWLLDQAFADTAEREYLIRLCEMRNITPKGATKALVIGRFSPADIQLNAGTKFNCGEYIYKIPEKPKKSSEIDYSKKITNIKNYISDADAENYCYYFLRCETEGRSPNGTTGKLIPSSNIAGLKTAEILQVEIGGEDEEETEALRQRYYDSFGSEAFGGNIADYKNKILSMNGVGGVKLYPAWNGGSTVRAVITAVGHEAPSLTLVESVQYQTDPEVIDGEYVKGLGYGFAPIGHYVTVMGANEGIVNIDITLTLKSGYLLENVKGDIEGTIKDYYSELNTNWMYSKNIIVQYTEVIARIKGLDYVNDVLNVSLNEKKENIIIDRDSLVILGEGSLNITEGA